MHVSIEILEFHVPLRLGAEAENGSDWLTGSAAHGNVNTRPSAAHTDRAINWHFINRAAEWSLKVGLSFCYWRCNPLPTAWIRVHVSTLPRCQGWPSNGYSNLEQPMICNHARTPLFISTYHSPFIWNLDKRPIPKAGPHRSSQFYITLLSLACKRVTPSIARNLPTARALPTALPPRRYGEQGNRHSLCFLSWFLFADVNSAKH